MKHHICPVCGFDGLREAPYNQDGQGSYEICPCCGFEYGFDDHSEGATHALYREKWIAAGASWFDAEERPEDWNLQTQLKNIDEDIKSNVDR